MSCAGRRTVWVAIGLTIALGWWLTHSRSGLILRAVGESPESAHALGYPVQRIRLAAVVAGKGWIALALTTFATWRPARALAGAYLFGGATMLQFHLQGQGVQIASQFLVMLPYLATILVLKLISRNAAWINAAWIKANMPASLGSRFRPAGRPQAGRGNPSFGRWQIGTAGA